MFDYSTNHHAMPDDALITSRMNLSDGSKQPNLRNTDFLNKGGMEVEQMMQHNSGVQKGLATVLLERGLWDRALEGAKKRVEADLQNDDGKKKKKIRVLKECAD